MFLRGLSRLVHIFADLGRENNEVYQVIIDLGDFSEAIILGRLQRFNVAWNFYHYDARFARYHVFTHLYPIDTGLKDSLWTIT